MKKSKLLMTVAVSAFIVCACGGSSKVADAAVTTLEVSKSGEITQVIVEDFSADYYDLEELKSQVEEETESFNSSKGDSLVKLVSVSQEDTNVRAILAYETPEAYGEFNSEVMAYGEGEDFALSDLPSQVMDENRNEVSLSTLDLTGKHIILTSSGTRIRTPYKIVYMSDGVTPISETEVDASTSSEDQVCIILEK